MRIGFDARMMGPEVRGIGRYCERLLARLADQDDGNEYIVFTRPEAAHLVPSKMKTVVTGIKWYGFAEQFELGKIFDAEKLDLIHVPHWNAPLLLRTPLAITIHDMILWEYPSLASTTLNPAAYFAKYLFYRLLVSRNAERAKIVFTVSESAKNSVLRNLKISPEKIIVTPNGFDPLPDPSGTAIPEKPYLLSVSSGYPHKNLGTFFRAAKELFSDDLRLGAVVAGTDPAFMRRLKDEARKILGEESGRVIFAGIVTDEALAGLYRNAEALIFTSRAEGFGFPVLEAMAAGAPVISSSIDAVREVSGGAAILVPTDDAGGYAAAFREIAGNPAKKSALISAGKRRAAAFSWKTTALLTQNGYNRDFSTR